MTRRLVVSTDDYHPAYVVWELTLRCDQPCRHCGSRAGAARPDELTTDEALRVVDDLAAMRAREVVLIGGEAYLHDGFLRLVEALAAAGIRPTMTTGAMGVTAELAHDMAAAGLASVSVSVDGLEVAHDLVRKAKGSYRRAMEGLTHLRTAGITVAANTNVNRVNVDDLEPLFDVLRAAGIASWQIQITAALGRAADRPQMLLQPYDLLDLLPRVAELKRRGYEAGILVMPGNNLGYFGTEETLLRSLEKGGEDHFHGCQAGKFVLGIESDGAVKGCPSLQTAAYVGGNLRREPLASIWGGSPELAFARRRTVEDLWGFCRTCPFAEVCMGGCTFTAHALFGRPGNNPYCHFRARTLREQGLRERLVPGRAAPGDPFDHGLFELVVEPWGAPEPEANSARGDLVTLRRRPSR